MTAPRPDMYRVRVWPRRKHVIGRLTFGPFGWVADVDYLSLWDDCGDQPLLTRTAAWFPSKSAAVEFGIVEAQGIHGDALAGDWPYSPDCVPGPLVVHVGPEVVIDETSPEWLASHTGGAS